MTNEKSLLERLRHEVEHPDTSGAPYCNDADLLAECLAEIERLSRCGCGGKVVCGTCGRQIPNVAAAEPKATQMAALDEMVRLSEEAGLYEEPNAGLNEHQIRAGYRSGKVADK